MPELPEVEVTAMHLREFLADTVLAQWSCSGKRLRHPVPKKAFSLLVGEPLLQIARRAKYLCLEFPQGWLVVHLGMSGSVQCLPLDAKTHSPTTKLHDHVVLRFRRPNSQEILFTYHDPRRFGSFQWFARQQAQTLQALGARLGSAALGVEPLEERFSGSYLFEHSRSVRTPIKNWLMSGRVVVGVGNIYACEALFSAGIHPARAAKAIAMPRYQRLANSIREILSQAITSGGSTISDFRAPDGESGRYGQSHRVYGREGEPCLNCGSPIARIVQQQRSTFYCPSCQR